MPLGSALSVGASQPTWRRTASTTTASVFPAGIAVAVAEDWLRRLGDEQLIVAASDVDFALLGARLPPPSKVGRGRHKGLLGYASPVRLVARIQPQSHSRFLHLKVALRATAAERSVVPMPAELLSTYLPL
jgi:hypothetical protein